MADPSLADLMRGVSIEKVKLVRDDVRDARRELVERDAMPGLRERLSAWDGALTDALLGMGEEVEGDG